MPKFDDGLLPANVGSLGPPASDGEIIVATGAGAFAYEAGATARASLGLAIGTDVQAHDSDLDALAGLTPSADDFIVHSGSAWTTASGATARTSLGLGSTDVVTFRNLNLTHSADPKISLKETGSSGIEMYDATGNFGVIRKLASSGGANLQVSATPQDGTSDSVINLQPGANTSGEVHVRIFNGGTGIQHDIRSNGGNSVLHNLSGNLSVGYTTAREKLDVNGGVAADYAVLDEQSAAPTTAASEGAIWVRNDTPNVPVFTDDAGTDHDVVLAAFHSEVVTATSTASAAKFDVFDQDNYGTLTTTQHASSGVTYTSTDGRFTIARAGTYQISITWVADVSAAADVDFSVEKSASQIYTARVNIPGAPTSHRADVIVTVSANDYINVFVDSTTASTVTVGQGTAIAIHRVG